MRQPAANSWQRARQQWIGCSASLEARLGQSNGVEWILAATPRSSENFLQIGTNRVRGDGDGLGRSLWRRQPRQLHSLVLTDVGSGLTEAAPLVVRESGLVVETLERIRARLPFALRALDVDNGTEFVNDRRIEHCLSSGIELTRSRPYRKSDQAWIEHKNSALVRKLLGYRRFQGVAAAQAMTRLHGAARLFVNFFQPSFKLAVKHCEGCSRPESLPPAADTVREASS